MKKYIWSMYKNPTYDDFQTIFQSMKQARSNAKKEMNSGDKIHFFEVEIKLKSSTKLEIVFLNSEVKKKT